MSGSGITTLSGLEYLDYLERLDVASNNLVDDDEVIPALSGMANLRNLDISENPIMNVKGARDNIIVATKSLGTPHFSRAS